MVYTVTVPDNYGYVVLVALGLTPVMAFGQGLVSGSLRKPAKVPYPNPYASEQQAKENQAAHKFNCSQRSHGNLLENMPQTMIFMLFAGLEYPTAAAALGVGWLVFRAIYAYGYIQSSKPQGKGRLNGSWFWLMQGGLWALCCATALKMI
ncbi:glutathione S-transferase [Exophiala viscosa]|uniref:Glutathione S-transferase n=1 Tax=Exophiala viscosa TaxID=2486360 RepID=A0AAN6IDD5_9EURO|nr:glutathione S-transferase [Exophiala viscosa]KAI1623674.1 glutathione S-transferase [Exophiala viscosa]